MGNATAYLCPADTVVVGRKGTINRPLFVREPLWNVDTAFGLVADRDVLLPEFLYHFCLQYDFSRLNRAATIPSLTKKSISEIEVPLPSMARQQELVMRLRAVNSLEGLLRRQFALLDDLVKSRFVEMFGDPGDSADGRWGKRRLDSFCSVVTGNTPSRKNPAYYGDALEWVKTDNIVDGSVTQADEWLSDEGIAKARVAPEGSVLMACIAGSVRSIGKVGLLDRDVAFNQQINAIIPGEDVDPKFLWAMLALSKDYLCCDVNMQLKGILNKSSLSAKAFPLPPLSLQREFATFAEAAAKSRVVVRQQVEKLQTLYDSLAQDYFS